MDKRGYKQQIKWLKGSKQVVAFKSSGWPSGSAILPAVNGTQQSERVVA